MTRQKQYRISRAILALAASIAAAGYASAQEPQKTAITPALEAQQTVPKSGALVALDSGQTLWIALVEGKIKVIATDDYVIPRKDGFWRIRLEFRTPPASKEGGAAESQPAGSPGALAQLWAVPLKSGGDALPWGMDADASGDSRDSDASASESSDSAMNSSQIDEPIRQDLHFLSPDHVSFFTQAGEYSETYHILKITDDTQPRAAAALPKLVVSEEASPVPDDVRSKDLLACANPNDELSNEDFLTGASESTYGIVRARGKWAYTWMLGYDSGALRGYHTGCGVSVLPPKSVVGANQFFPAWNVIKDVYPDAQDVFSSPAHDLILVVSANRLIVAPVQQGKVGKPLARLDLEGQPVMVEWALGKYVDAWTQELTPYFGPYTPKAKPAQ
jgi:hypothetical protein